MNQLNKNTMKKIFLTLMALLLGHIMVAQTESCLIVKEYGPNSWTAYTGGRYYVDMNDDGVYDFDYEVGVSHTMNIYIDLMAKEGACFHKIDIPGFEYNYPDDFNTFTDFDTPFNDSALIWETDFYGPRIFSEKNRVGHYRLDTLVYKSGIRNGREGEYYYGWMEAYAVVSYNYDTVYFNLARTCYCTIPNYPLKWGQTSLDTGVDEIGGSEFATLYPNPADGIVTVTGKALGQAEVFNTLGQCILTVTSEGDELLIDMKGLPAGIYIVTVTDAEGHKCVKKVVKE